MKKRLFLAIIIMLSAFNLVFFMRNAYSLPLKWFCFLIIIVGILSYIGLKNCEVSFTISEQRILSLYVSLSSFLSSVLIQTFALLLIKSAVDYIFLFVFSKGYFKGSEL